MHIAFLLQPHFSLLAFTAAADTLTTANLVLPSPAFRMTTVGQTRRETISDLGILIHADHSMRDVNALDADALVVCGGYRCELDEDIDTSQWLQTAVDSQILMGGLWNGAIPLAHAGLMDGYHCALHPDSRDYAQRQLPDLRQARRTVVLDRIRMSAAGPNSALDLMLALVQRAHNGEVVAAIRHILRADDPRRDQTDAILERDSERNLPAKLQLALQLMRNNLDELLTREELAGYLSLSTRGVERLFQKHMQTSPTRHYLELRLQRAHELLLQSDESVASIADACGFVSAAHFSRSFTERFGASPRSVRQARD